MNLLCPLPQHRRRRKRHPLMALLLVAVTAAVCLLLHITARPPRTAPSVDASGDPSKVFSLAPRRLLQSASSGEPSAATNGSASSSGSGSSPSNDTLFPPDAFTMQQRRDGAVVLHVLGMMYMFVALALVCDEFFVPSLDVITERLGISEDVAGATFMAAGGSAPELFTSIIGVFIAKNDVGIGTIVGSAVFNILFVIAMCVIFSRTVLVLTWWPLFRDVTFYSISLLMLVQFFGDNEIFWWEALLLFLWYIFYCVFMKFNASIERVVKSILPSKRVDRVKSAEGSSASKKGTRRRPSTPHLHTGSKFRQGLLQLMLHTIDPLNTGKLDERATQLQVIATLNMLPNKDARDSNGRTRENGDDTGVMSTATATSNAELSPSGVDLGAGSVSAITEQTSVINGSGAVVTSATDAAGVNEDMEEDDDETKPIDLSWPSSLRKRVVYVLVAPIIFVLWITLPDCKSPKGRRFFIVTFLGSILWIAVFSYLMVWWASVMSDTLNIPPEVVGLTILAAGTSVPDLITSVIVARKGFGDMAVSSSVGSNLFDICVGLPIPWLLDSLARAISQLVAGQKVNVMPTLVKSEGMRCSVILLFSMLILIIVSIALFKWRMNKGLGVVMFLLYFVFVAFSLSFELKSLPCLL